MILYVIIDNSAGAILIYVKSGQTWSLQQEILSTYSASRFGSSLAFSSLDGTLAVGASDYSKFL